jgi:hypothetical protein
MKKVIILLVIASAAGYLLLTKKGNMAKNVAMSYIISPSHVYEEGRTISERILVPQGYTRVQYSEGSFQKYIQDYDVLDFEAKIINYDGNEYVFQGGHVGVLDISVPANGLQQCADALMRIRAEYLWNTNQKDKIGFNFTSGHYCSWLQYAAGYRPQVNGNHVSFQKTATPNNLKEQFYKYLDLVYMYAGTQSLYDELSSVNSIDAVEVGDMLIYPGSPGHVVLIADMATNAEGKKLFILAQGNTPAQSVHLLKNINDSSISPWYELEMDAYLEIPTYYFNKTQFIRFKDL